MKAWLPERIRYTALAQRQAIEAGETDVLVVGGGIAGCAAAWAAGK